MLFTSQYGLCLLKSSLCQEADSDRSDGIPASVAAGITGVWLAFPVTEGLVAALGVVFFIRWRKTLPAS